MTQIVHHTVLVPATPAEVFSLFTDQVELARWLARRAHVEPHVGGAFELFWDLDDPTSDSTLGCRITALAAPHLLAFDWRSPRQFKAFANDADPLTHCVVTCVPEGAHTRVHLVHSGWRTTDSWPQAQAWQERAWAMAFASLVSYVGTRFA